jgi:hypothetical protein
LRIYGVALRKLKIAPLENHRSNGTINVIELISVAYAMEVCYSKCSTIDVTADAVVQILP